MTLINYAHDANTQFMIPTVMNTTYNKEKLLFNNKKKIIRTRGFKKLNQIAFRGLITNEEKRCSIFEDTRIITYNEEFEFDTREFERLSKQATIYKFILQKQLQFSLHHPFKHMFQQ